MAASNPVTGNAGYDAGFPATNMTPKEAGGIPPFGQDFNGILFDITTAIRYLQAGMQFPYSSSFATAVGGYPLGAIVTRTDGTGFWRNTVANNTTDPEDFGAGWSPEGSGISTVAMSNANVTLTALKAARPIIVITGAITANLNLIFPTYSRQWLVVNRSTGAFSVTCKTASGSGVPVSSAFTQSVYGDGTNIGIASATQAQQSSVGAFSNLRLSTTGSTGIVTISADEIVLEAAVGNYLTARSVSISALNISGSGANGLDTGSPAVSTWYSAWVISNGSTISGLLSLSTTAPTMPSGFTYKARVGWVRSGATASVLLGVRQAGKRSQLLTPRAMSIGAQGTTAPTPAWVAVSISPYVPPTSASINVTAHNATQATATLVAPNNSYLNHESNTNPPPLVVTAPSVVLFLSMSASMLLESTNIYYASSDPSGSVVCTGWEDNL